MYTDNAVGKFSAQYCKSQTTFSQIKVASVRIISTSGAFKATWTKHSKAQRGGIAAESFSMAFILFFFCFPSKHERMDWHIKEKNPTYRMLLWTQIDVQQQPHHNVGDVWCSSGWYGKMCLEILRLYSLCEFLSTQVAQWAALSTQHCLKWRGC